MGRAGKHWRHARQGLLGGSAPSANSSPQSVAPVASTPSTLATHAASSAPAAVSSAAEPSTTSVAGVVTATSTRPAPTTAASTAPTTAARTTVVTSSTASTRAAASSSPSSSGAGVAPTVVVATVGGSTVSIPSNVFASGSPALASASGAAQQGGDTGTSAGTVVGIAAGALAGLIVLAALVGMALKKKWGKRDDDFPDDPFGNEKSFGLIPDHHSDEGHAGYPHASHQMHNIPSGLGRSGTMLTSRSGSVPWKPQPASHQGHLAPPMLSVQPGQVVSYGPEGGLDRAASMRSTSPQPGMNMGPPYGAEGYPVGGGYPAYSAPSPVYAHNMLGAGPAGVMPQQPNPAMLGGTDPNVAALERAASHYGSSGGSASSHGGWASAPPSHDAYPGFAGPRPLSLVHEEDEPRSARGPVGGPEAHGRTGTPDDDNVQQSYFAHRHDDSVHSLSFSGYGAAFDFSGDGGHHGGEAATAPAPGGQEGRLDLSLKLPGESGGLGGHWSEGPAGAPEGVTRQLVGGDGRGAVGREERAKRTLSVRNAGMDDSPYGGI